MPFVHLVVFKTHSDLPIHAKPFSKESAAPRTSTTDVRRGRQSLHGRQFGDIARKDLLGAFATIVIPASPFTHLQARVPLLDPVFGAGLAVVSAGGNVDTDLNNEGFSSH